MLTPRVSRLAISLSLCGIFLGCSVPNVEIGTSQRKEFSGNARKAIYLENAGDLFVLVEATPTSLLGRWLADDDASRSALILLTLRRDADSSSYRCEGDCGAVLLPSPVGPGTYRAFSAGLELRETENAQFASAFIELLPLSGKPSSHPALNPDGPLLLMLVIPIRPAASAGALLDPIPVPFRTEGPIASWAQSVPRKVLQ